MQNGQGLGLTVVSLDDSMKPLVNVADAGTYSPDERGDPLRPDPGTSLDGLAREVQAALARGDRAAACAHYELLVERLQRRANRLAWWYVRDRADADDAVQEAFVRAFERIGQFRPERSFEAWFLGVLTNACRDRRRARKRWRGVHADDEGGPAVELLVHRGPSPDEQLLRDERTRALADALAALPARQRLVVVLSHLEGLRGPEIGDIIGASAATVRVHLHRGLRRLRHLLTAVRSTGPGGQADVTRKG